MNSTLPVYEHFLSVNEFEIFNDFLENIDEPNFQYQKSQFNFCGEDTQIFSFQQWIQNDYFLFERQDVGIIYLDHLRKLIYINFEESEKLVHKTWIIFKKIVRDYFR